MVAGNAAEPVRPEVASDQKETKNCGQESYKDQFWKHHKNLGNSIDADEVALYLK